MKRKFLEYHQKIIEKYETILKKDQSKIIEIATLMRETVQNKGAIYVFGASHAGIITEELFYRAGGVALINPIFDKRLLLNVSPVTNTTKVEQKMGVGQEIGKTIKFKQGDLLLLHSVSGRNPVIIDLALHAKSIGVKVVAITNLAYSSNVTSKHDSKKRLFEIVDMAIDNQGCLGDAEIFFDEISHKMAPSSTLTGVFIANSIMIELVQQMLEANLEPPVFYSANLDGGEKKNQKIFNLYKNQIKYKL